ncbi:MAG: cell division protein FtsW, partial [Hyphomicrobium sp.]|nr:cell division protein FtsW [Hyphomicrobium sp.]
MRLARDDRSLVSEWWFSVDRALLIAVLALIGVGIVLSLAASPAVATRKGLPTFYFVERHLVFAMAGIVLMLLASLLDPRGVLTLAVVLLGVGLVLMVAAVLYGPEVNGARRWVRFGGFSLQPSELLKPAFAVVVAWLFAEERARPGISMVLIAVGLYIVAAGLLLRQPDVGQWMLLTLVFGALFFISGQPIAWALAFGGIGVGGVTAAYFAFPHVRGRVARFLDPASGDTFQTDRAIQSFAEGGFFGRGPGEGTIKSVLPDAHTDFIFAVVAEEYGAFACLLLIALFAFVVGRALMRYRHRRDPFTHLAVNGLALLIALQASINMAVNVGLVPAKGMTLPFISAGGSSMIAASLTVGMLLAL